MILINKRYIEIQDLSSCTIKNELFSLVFFKLAFMIFILNNLLFIRTTPHFAQKFLFLLRSRNKNNKLLKKEKIILQKS